MKHFFNKKTLIAIIAFFVLSLPTLTLALDFNFFHVVNCGGQYEYGGGEQPPCDFNAFVDMLNNIIKWFMGMAIAIASVTFAVAGIKILINPGNAGEISKAKDMARKSIYGMVLLLGCWIIVYVIMDKLTVGGSLLKFLQK